jgi:hypothetical protein
MGSLYEKLVEAGYCPQSYSGRGMFGKTCVSVALEAWDLVYDLGKDVGEVAPRPKLDQLGMGVVAYWPREPWLDTYPKGEGNEDED